MNNNLIVLDCETGGHNPDEHPITQLALQVVVPRTWEVIERYSAFVKPYGGLKVTAEALTYSRVTMAQINKGLTLDELLKALTLIFKRANKTGKPGARPYIVAHNAAFDSGFLIAAFKQRNKNVFDLIDPNFIDTLPLAKLFESLKPDKEIGSYKLGVICERLNISLKGAHGAAADVEATKQLFIKLINSLRYDGNDANNLDASISTMALHSGASRRSHARDGFHFEF